MSKKTQSLSFSVSQSLLLALFGVALLSFLIFSDQSFKEFSVSFKKHPALTFEKVESFIFDKDSVSVYAKANQVIKFDDKDQLYDVKIKFLHNNDIYTVVGNEAVFKNKTITFKGNTNLVRQNDFKLNSQSILYNGKNKTININQKFNFNRKNINLTGDSLVFNIKNKNLKINNVDARIKLGKPNEI